MDKPTPQAVEEALAWADSTKAASENAHHARVLALALRESRSEIAALRAERDAMRIDRDAQVAALSESLEAAYAQGVEVTEARASKRIAELEADYERVQKLLSDAGSRGHELLKEVTWLKSRMAEIHKKWEAAEARLAEATNALKRIAYIETCCECDDTELDDCSSCISRAALAAPSTQEKP